MGSKTSLTANTNHVFDRAERLAVEATYNPALQDDYETATREAKRLEGAYRMRNVPMTQVEKIINHIHKTGSITQREAYIDYGIQSFHRRLADLKEMGWSVTGTEKIHPTTGQKYTRYTAEWAI